MRMAANKSAQPKASRPVKDSFKNKKPPKRENTDSKLRIKLAVVGSVWRWPMICRVKPTPL